MGETAHGAIEGAAERGAMDIQDQKSTFKHFLNISLWGTVYTTMAVALLTVAFAMGYGWFPGLSAYVAIGAVAGFALGMRGGWWALLIGSTIVLALGGFVTLLFR